MIEVIGKFPELVPFTLQSESVIIHCRYNMCCINIQSYGPVWVPSVEVTQHSASWSLWTSASISTQAFLSSSSSSSISFFSIQSSFSFSSTIHYSSFVLLLSWCTIFFFVFFFFHLVIFVIFSPFYIILIFSHYLLYSNFVSLVSSKLFFNIINWQHYFNFCDRNNLKNWRGSTQTEIYFQ